MITYVWFKIYKNKDSVLYQLNNVDDWSLLCMTNRPCTEDKISIFRRFYSLWMNFYAAYIDFITGSKVKLSKINILSLFWIPSYRKYLLKYFHHLSDLIGMALLCTQRTTLTCTSHQVNYEIWWLTTTLALPTVSMSTGGWQLSWICEMDVTLHVCSPINTRTSDSVSAQFRFSPWNEKHVRVLLK